MFFALPVADRPNPPGRPWATYFLIGANFLVYLAITLPLQNQPIDLGDETTLVYLREMAAWTGQSLRELAHHATRYDVVVFAHGFRPSSPTFLSMFTYMFLHGGLLHLVGNMLFLHIAGDNVEQRLGRILYVAAYLTMGVVSAAVFGGVSGSTPTPMVGASGAVFGVLGCYFLWFPHNRVVLLVVVVWFLRVVEVPARWVLGIYVVVADMLPLLLGDAGPVAHAAHVGGFLAGLGIAYGVGLLSGERRAAAAAEVSAASRPTSPSALFNDAVAAGDWDRARGAYTRMIGPEKDRLHHADVFDLADHLTTAGEYESALRVLRRFIAIHPTHPALAAAHIRAGMLHLRALGRPATANQHFLAALDLTQDQVEAQVARAGLAEARSRDLATLH
jgi:membrane associated rhomboid family serine protease